jgi:hypothetical protein
MGILTWPFNGLIRIFEEVAERAEHEMYNEEAVMAELTELYRKLESGDLSEEEFGRREVSLVQRLEEIEARNRRRSRGSR